MSEQTLSGAVALFDALAAAMEKPKPKEEEEDERNCDSHRLAEEVFSRS